MKTRQSDPLYWRILKGVTVALAASAGSTQARSLSSTTSDSFAPLPAGAPEHGVALPNGLVPPRPSPQNALAPSGKTPLSRGPTSAAAPLSLEDKLELMDPTLAPTDAFSAEASFLHNKAREARRLARTVVNGQTRDMTEPHFMVWLAEHAGAGFLARQGDGGTPANWLFVTDHETSPASHTYRLTDTQGAVRALGLNATQLLSNVTFVQGIAPAEMFTRLRARRGGDGGEGQVYRFVALTRQPDGSPGLNVEPFVMGIHDPARTGTLNLTAFNALFGPSGIQGLLVGAQGEPPQSYNPGQFADAAGVRGDGKWASTHRGDNSRQGMIADCYVPATLEGLEHHDPDALVALGRPSANGNPHQYDVGPLYVEDDAGNLQPRNVTIDSRVPVIFRGYNATPTAAGVDFVSRAGVEGATNMAPAMIEKALAQLHQDIGKTYPGTPNPAAEKNQGVNGYRSIEQGTPGQLMATLKGWRDIAPDGGDPEIIWQHLSAANTGGWVVATTNKPGSPYGPWPGTGVYGGHAYTILGTATQPNGTRMVNLRNPDGRPDISESDGSFTYGNQFALSYTNFQRYFGSVYHAENT